MTVKSGSSLAPRLLPMGGSSIPGVTQKAQRRISSRQLLGDAASLVIEHDGESYVLRATRLGKLILTK